MEQFLNRYQDHKAGVQYLQKEYQQLKEIHLKYEQLEKALQEIKEKQKLEHKVKSVERGKQNATFERF